MFLFVSFHFFACCSGCDGADEEVDHPKTKPDTSSSVSEEGNINISNVTNIVVGRVGNMFGKSIGGLSTKFGGGSWF